MDDDAVIGVSLELKLMISTCNDSGRYIVVMVVLYLSL